MKYKFSEALKKQYVSVMFDIDGTITEIGEQEIPDSLAQKMADLSLNMPLAFGTGRRIDHLQDKLDEIISKSSDPETTRKNWYVIAENGAAGYFYNPTSKSYEEFYRIEWDDNLIDRKDLKKKMEEAGEGLIKSISLNTTQFLIRPYRGELEIREVQKNTAKIVEIANKILKSYPNAEKFEVLDSSIAVHISPKNANKDEGIRRYAQFLEDRLGINTGALARNIMVIGDQAAPGRNDYAFLKGDIGTPFTVEDTNTGSEWPLPVFNDDKLVRGPEATLYLINKANFALH